MSPEPDQEKKSSRRLRLSLRKTDTSRVKKKDTGRLKKPEEESAPEGAAAPELPPTEAPQAPPADETTITDPMALRDTTTSRLRRVQPEIESTAAALAPEGGAGTGGGAKRKVTETVRLKIVREKKKQLADMLTASQTVKIRPSQLGGPGAPTAPVAVPPSDSAVETQPSISPPTPQPPPRVVPPAAPAPEEAETAEAPAATTPPTVGQTPRKTATATLKLRPGRPAMVPPPQAAATPPPPAAPAGDAGATIKLKPPTPTPAPTPAQPKEPGATDTSLGIEEDKEAQKRKTAKLTLKVKPRPSTAQTVKIPGVVEAPPPPAAAPASTVKVKGPPSPPPTAETVRVETPPAVEETAPPPETPQEGGRARRTLKLKRGPRQPEPQKEEAPPSDDTSAETLPTIESPVGEAAESPEVVPLPEAAAVAAGTEPGLLFMILSVVAAVAVLFMTGLTAYQFLKFR